MPTPEPSCRAKDLCPCRPDSSDVELKVKHFTKCGIAIPCAGVSDPANGPESPMRYARVESTQPAEIWDRTGPGGVLVVTECSIFGFTDTNPSGSGWATGPCGEFLPDCGGTESDSEGCEDVEMCGDVPGPGQKCYFTTGPAVLTYMKGINTDNAASAAIAAATWSGDDDWSYFDAGDVIGRQSIAQGTATEYTLLIRRRGPRVPVQILITWEEEDADLNVTEHETLLYIPAPAFETGWTLAIGAPETVRTITNVEVIYGTIP